VKVVKKEECTFKIPSDDIIYKPTCKEKLDNLKDSLHFENVNGGTYELKIGETKDDKTSYTFTDMNSKENACLKIDMLNEVNKATKMKKVEQKSTAKLKEVKKKVLKKVVE